MPEQKAHKPTTKNVRIRYIFRELSIPLLMIIPSLLLLLLFGSAQRTLDENTYENLKYDIDNYYYAGWPFESIKYRVDMTDPYQTDDIAEIRSDLYYYYDRELADITDRIRSSKENASVLYLDKIAQPTDHLEHLYSELEEGIQLENYEMISNNLFEISTEIEALREDQIDDIALMTKNTAHAVESINLIGRMYGLTLDEYVTEAQQITQSQTNDLLTYKQLLPVKKEAAAHLDEKIVARGGVATDGKRILISISRQRLYMIEDYNVIYDMPASTGVSGHGTAAGEFQVYAKIDMAWGYYRIWMPYWMTIYYSGSLENGIHGIPISPVRGRWDGWDRAVGNYPITYGCVMPHDWDAEVVYKWAEIGTPVSIVY